MSKDGARLTNPFGKASAGKSQGIASGHKSDSTREAIRKQLLEALEISVENNIENNSQLNVEIEEKVFALSGNNSDRAYRDKCKKIISRLRGNRNKHVRDILNSGSMSVEEFCKLDDRTLNDDNYFHINDHNSVNKGSGSVRPPTVSIPASSIDLSGCGEMNESAGMENNPQEAQSTTGVDKKEEKSDIEIQEEEKKTEESSPVDPNRNTQTSINTTPVLPQATVGNFPIGPSIQYNPPKKSQNKNTPHSTNINNINESDHITNQTFDATSTFTVKDKPNEEILNKSFTSNPSTKLKELQEIVARKALQIKEHNLPLKNQNQNSVQKEVSGGSVISTARKDDDNTNNNNNNPTLHAMNPLSQFASLHGNEFNLQPHDTENNFQLDSKESPIKEHKAQEPFNSESSTPKMESQTNCTVLLTHSKEQMKKLNETKLALETDLEYSRKECQTYEKEVFSLREAVKELRFQLTQVNEENLKLEISKLKQSLSMKDLENERINKENDYFKKQLKMHQETISIMIEDSKAFRSEAEKRFAQYQREIENLRKEIVASKKMKTCNSTEEPVKVVVSDTFGKVNMNGSPSIIGEVVGSNDLGMNGNTYDETKSNDHLQEEKVTIEHNEPSGVKEVKKGESGATIHEGNSNEKNKVTVTHSNSSVAINSQKTSANLLEEFLADEEIFKNDHNENLFDILAKKSHDGDI